MEKATFIETPIQRKQQAKLLRQNGMDVLDLSYEDYVHNIGKTCHKLTTTGGQPKPFKSKSKINTIKGIIEHPILHEPAYIFFEDDSYVLCRGVMVIGGEELARKLARRHVIDDTEREYSVKDIRDLVANTDNHFTQATAIKIISQLLKRCESTKSYGEGI